MADVTGSRISFRQVGFLIHPPTNTNGDGNSDRDKNGKLSMEEMQKSMPKLSPGIEKQLSAMHFECDPSLQRLGYNEHKCPSCEAPGNCILFFNAQEYLTQLDANEAMVMVCMCTVCRKVFPPPIRLFHTTEIESSDTITVSTTTTTATIPVIVSTTSAAAAAATADSTTTSTTSMRDEQPLKKRKFPFENESLLKKKLNNNSGNENYNEKEELELNLSSDLSLLSKAHLAVPAGPNIA
jgi:hypothetical protein